MTNETKKAALAALKQEAGNAKDNYRRASRSSAGWASASADGYKADWERLKAAIAELEAG